MTVVDHLYRRWDVSVDVFWNLDVILIDDYLGKYKFFDSIERLLVINEPQGLELRGRLHSFDFFFATT